VTGGYHAAELGMYLFLELSEPDRACYGLDVNSRMKRWSIRQAKARKWKAAKTLEHPTHGRLVGGLLDLAGDRLPGSRELRAQSVLGEPYQRRVLRSFLG
jgi:hypothetical protein